jgi:fatty-acid desaturase
LFCGDWHNNHHNKATNWNQREKWWEFDIPAQIIKLIKVKD